MNRKEERYEETNSVGLLSDNSGTRSRLFDVRIWQNMSFDLPMELNQQQQYHYLLIEENKMPKSYEYSKKDECRTLENRKACFEECDKDNNCKEVFSYHDGNCCMIKSSDENQGWVTRNNGNYYKKVKKFTKFSTTYNLIRKNEQPKFSVSTNIGCLNLADKEICFDDCTGDDTCKEVLYKKNGECCKKEASDPNQGWESIADAEYFKKEKTENVYYLDYQLLGKDKQPVNNYNTDAGCQNYQSSQKCFDECDKDENCKELWLSNTNECCLKKSSNKDSWFDSVDPGGSYYIKIKGDVSTNYRQSIKELEKSLSDLDPENLPPNVFVDTLKNASLTDLEAQTKKEPVQAKLINYQDFISLYIKKATGTNYPSYYLKAVNKAINARANADLLRMLYGFAFVASLINPFTAFSKAGKALKGLVKIGNIALKGGKIVGKLKDGKRVLKLSEKTAASKALVQLKKYTLKKLKDTAKKKSKQIKQKSSKVRRNSLEIQRAKASDKYNKVNNYYDTVQDFVEESLEAIEDNPLVAFFAPLKRVFGSPWNSDIAKSRIKKQLIDGGKLNKLAERNDNQSKLIKEMLKAKLGVDNLDDINDVRKKIDNVDSKYLKDITFLTKAIRNKPGKFTKWNVGFFAQIKLKKYQIRTATSKNYALLKLETIKKISKSSKNKFFKKRNIKRKY